MEEQTTTEAPVETGVERTQPVEAEQTTAVEQTTEPEQQTEGTSTGQDLKPKKELGADEYSKQLDTWAQRKGLVLDSEGARKAAEMAMEAERNMHQTTKRTSELEKNLANRSDEYAEQVAQQTGQDPGLLKRLQRVEVREAVRDFWNTPTVNGQVPDRAYEAKMIELVQQKPHLAGDLEALYATAVVKAGKLESQGGRKALETLAHKQQAAVPTGNATNPGVTSKEKPFAEMSIAEMEAKLGFARR